MMHPGLLSPDFIRTDHLNKQSSNILSLNLFQNLKAMDETFSWKHIFYDSSNLILSIQIILNQIIIK